MEVSKGTKGLLFICDHRDNNIAVLENIDEYLTKLFC